MAASIPESTLERFTTFGDLLRFLRRRAGITQMELSIAVGYSDAQISRLEQNLRMPDIPTIEARFISALGLEHEPKAVARLLDLAANVRREDVPGLGICPYKGLNYFEEGDADLFVGREILVAKLIERVFALTSNETLLHTRFLAIVGASGSGKSSLVRAGLIPALRWNKKSADWQIHIFTPTAHPLESLATVLTQDNPSVTQTATFMDDLSRDIRSLQLFIKRKLQSEDNTRVLLVVDQFEEIFTLCRAEEERASFIGNLLTAATEAAGPVIILIAMRADFYAYCANYIQLREALGASQEYIGSMNEDELRRVIEEPAQRGRWELEDGLVNLLLHDVGHEPGALPLLSHALMETWQRRRGRTMTLSGYTSSGGVRGAIAETAEAVFTDRFSREQHDIARRIFLRLTELGDETATGDTRRRATINELILKADGTNSTEVVLKVLADARLITTSEDSIEVAHEALIREWPRLRAWLEDNRDGLRLHRRLTEAAQEWATLAREPELLYRGARLTQAEEWAVVHREEMNELEREFLDASSSASERALAEREAQRERDLESAQRLAESEKQRAEQQTSFAKQLGKRAMYLTGAFIIAILMALTTLYFGAQARRTAIIAQSDRRIATSRELAAASLNNLTVDPERSLLLAMQSVSTTQLSDGTVLQESLEALHRSIISSPIRMTLKEHDTRVLSISYRPDGKQFASIGDDGTVIFWDALTGKELLRLSGTTEPGDFVSPQRVEYSPDGSLLAACDNNQIKLIDPDSGSVTESLTGHTAEITAVTFSADGRFIASGSLDGAIIIWNTSTGKPHLKPSGHTEAIEGLTFSPDGKWLISAGDDNALRIWDTYTGSLLQEYTDFTSEVGGVAFSPDGTQFTFSDGTVHVWQFNFNSVDGKETIINKELFTIPGATGEVFSPNGSQFAGISGTQIKVWDSATGRELLSLAGHNNWVMGIAYSPDGKQLASTSLDGTVKVWSLEPGNETITVTEAAASFGNRIAYNPKKQEFATNGGDGSVTFWNSETGKPQSVLKGHDQEILSLAFNSDGTRFATGSLDTTVSLWDTSAGQKLLTLSGHEAPVRDIDFSTDGSLIATGSFDGSARIWSAKTGKQVLKISGHEGLVLGVAFSPDGIHLATASTDTTAKIWDTRTGQLIFTLTGHNAGIRDIAYSPDGTQLVTGSADGTAILWDIKTGSQILTLKGHSSGITAVSFSPDGALLATGSEDNTAKLWDVKTGTELLTLPGDKSGVTGIAFSPSDGGLHLAVASPDGVVRIFLLQFEDLLNLAQSRITRTLTATECQQFLHANTCPSEP